MSYDLVLVNASAILLIIFVLWWFFWSKPKAVTKSAEETITILVKDGIYDPANINVTANKAIKLRFIRYDAAPCAETVTFPSLELAYSLPVGDAVDIILPPQNAGTVEFTCQMGMYRGLLTVA